MPRLSFRKTEKKEPKPIDKGDRGVPKRHETRISSRKRNRFNRAKEIIGDTLKIEQELEKHEEISHTTEFLGLRLSELKNYDESEFFKEDNS